jgi:RHS repeat-associated protein
LPTQGQQLVIADHSNTGEYTGDYMELLYLRARFYVPSTGRFATADPSKFEANLFLYAKANPINRSDPSGLFSSEIIAKNINESAFWDYDDWTGHGHWAFYALMQQAEDSHVIRTAYVSISDLGLGENFTGVYWTVPQTVRLINCEKIMIGSQTLEQYFSSVVKKQNEPWLYWRDTSAIMYELNSKSSARREFLDGLDNGVTTYPDYVGLSEGLWFGEIGAMFDMDGNRYLSFSTGLGFSLGISYVEGYLCDWRAGPSCSVIPSQSDIEAAIAGLCLGGEIDLLLGINVSPLCHGANLSAPLDWSSSATTYYSGLQVGLGAGGTVMLPLSWFGYPAKPDRSWRWLIEKRSAYGITGSDIEYK